MLGSIHEIRRGHFGRGNHAVVRDVGRVPCTDRRIVHLTVVNARFIVGTGSGTGTLSYQGKEYRLSVVSVGFGTIGVAGAELAGTAYNLWTAADIAGTYRAVAAGLTVGGGAQVARFQNANGVILELLGVQLGLEVVLGSAGMTIALQ
jgi:hypothetical protein